MAIGIEIEPSDPIEFEGDKYSIGIANKAYGGWRGDGDYGNDFLDVTESSRLVQVYGSGVFQLVLRSHKDSDQQDVPNYNDFLTRNEFLLICEENGGKLVVNHEDREFVLNLEDGERMNMADLDEEIVLALGIPRAGIGESDNDELREFLGLSDDEEMLTWVSPVYEMALKCIWLVAEESSIEVSEVE